MPHLSQEAVHRPGTRYSLYAGEWGHWSVVGSKCKNIEFKEEQNAIWWLGAQRNNWWSSQCNTRKNRYWTGNLWDGRYSRERHGGETKGFGAKKPRFFIIFLKSQNNTINLMLCVFINTIILFMLRHSEEKAESGRFWWRGWRWWAGFLFPATCCSSASGRFRPSFDSAWFPPCPWCSRDPASWILRCPKEFSISAKKHPKLVQFLLFFSFYFVWSSV